MPSHLQTIVTKIVYAKDDVAEHEKVLLYSMNRPGKRGRAETNAPKQRIPHSAHVPGPLYGDSSIVNVQSTSSP